MITTHDVPMPEPAIHGVPKRLPQPISVGCDYYTADQVRDTAIKYADARCAEVLAEAIEWRDMEAAVRAERDAYKAADEAMQEEVGRLHAEIHELKAERDALAEKVKELQANDRPARELKNGEVLVEVHGLTGSGKSAVAGEIEILCKALGLQVQWENGDEEKFLTHADWTAALELYNPRVRIVEVNTPRPAIRGTDAAIDAAGEQP